MTAIEQQVRWQEIRCILARPNMSVFVVSLQQSRFWVVVKTTTREYKLFIHKHLFRYHTLTQR
jgi:hypothetical protein